MKFINSEIKPEIAYAILALFFGILFIFIVPPFYVQDEVHHFYRAYQLSDAKLIGDKRWRNLYLISVKSVAADGVPPIRWSEMRPFLVKDQKNDIYIYGLKDQKWKYTKLNNVVFADIHFPAQNETPIFLREQDKKPELYAEIAEKGGLYPIALYQSGGFLPTSIVETTTSLMHHLPLGIYKEENRLKISTFYKLFSQDLHPEIKTFTDFNNTVLYAPFSYLPQVCGIAIGKIFQLPPIMLLYLARLFAFLCSMTLIYYALKLTPILKWSMFLLALMPMTFWETASASYDNLTISLSFLLIAVFFYYAFTKTEIKVFDVVSLFILTGLVSLSKMTYLPLIFLYLLIPKNKVGSLNKYLMIFFSLLFVNILLAGSWSLLVHKAYVSYIYDGNIDPHAQLLYVLKHPLHFCGVLWRYCSTFGWMYFESFVGMLGYLNAPQIFLLNIYFVALLVVPFISSQGEIQLEARQKIITGSVFVLNFLVVFLLIYISSTVVGAQKIYGMRQRYLIPFAVLFFSVLQYRIPFQNQANVEYYKTRFLPILSSIMLSITLLAIICEDCF